MSNNSNCQNVQIEMMNALNLLLIIRSIVTRDIRLCLNIGNIRENY